MFQILDDISRKPEVFSHYTAASLWADEHRSKQMLDFHLNEGLDVSSRNARFINASADWIKEAFDLGPGKSVCDFGCGPGLYTSRLAKSGARVTGLDFSANSIGYATEQAEIADQPITYTHTDYLEFQPKETFDLVTMIMCDFCALSPGQRQTLLRTFRKALRPGGSVLLDVYSMVAFADRQEQSIVEKNQLDHFWCEEEYYCFVNTFKYDDDAVVLDKYDIFPKNGEHQTVYNWLQYFSREDLIAELSDAGFQVSQVLGDVAGAPLDEASPEFAIVAVNAD